MTAFPHAARVTFPFPGGGLAAWTLRRAVGLRLLRAKGALLEGNSQPDRSPVQPLLPMGKQYNKVIKRKRRAAIRGAQGSRKPPRPPRRRQAQARRQTRRAQAKAPAKPKTPKTVCRLHARPGTRPAPARLRAAGPAAGGLRNGRRRQEGGGRAALRSAVMLHPRGRPARIPARGRPQRDLRLAGTARPARPAHGRRARRARQAPDRLPGPERRAGRAGLRRPGRARQRGQRAGRHPGFLRRRRAARRTRSSNGWSPSTPPPTG